MLAALFPAITWQLISYAVEKSRKERRQAAALAKRIHVPDPTPPDLSSARNDLKCLVMVHGAQVAG